MAAGFDGTIKIDTSVNSKGFNSGIKSMIGSVQKLAAVVGIAFGIGAVVAFGRTAVQTASDMASALIGLQSVAEATGNSFTTAQGFIEEFTQDGLVPAQDAIIAYKTLLAKGFDSTGIEKILNVTKDTAAFNRQAGLTIGQAIQRTAEGIKNENSVLTDSGGITKNLSIIYKEYADSLGVTVEALTEAQKRQAVLNGFEKEGAIFAGDAAKLTNTYAGQVAALGVSFTNFKVAVGNAIIPVITKILPYIRAAIDALTAFAQRVATIISILFGVQIGQASQTTAAMDASADSTNAAAEAQDNLAGSTAKAGKAAKGALAAFDQITVLQQNTDTGGGGGGTGDIPGLGGGVALPELDTSLADESIEKLREKVTKFKEDLITLFTPAREAFGRLVEALKPLGLTIWQGLIFVWENVLQPFGKWAAQQLLPKFFDLLAAAAGLLNNVLIGISPLLQNLFDNLKPFAEAIGNKIIEFLGWFAEKLNELGKWISENPEKFQTFVKIIVALGAAFALLEPIIITALAITSLLSIVIPALAAAFTFLISPIGLVIVAIVALIAIGYLIIKNWDLIKEKALETWNSIKNALFDLNNKIVENIKTFMDSVWSAINDRLTMIRNKWMEIFSSVRDFTKGVINSIIDAINGMIRGIVTGINTVANGFNVVASVVPGFSPIALLSAPQIPRLATGAVIPPNSEFMAILGDQRSGRNIEAPENLIRQIIREEMRGFSGGETTVEIPLYLDGEIVFRNQKKINGRHGRSLVSAT